MCVCVCVCVCMSVLVFGCSLFPLIVLTIRTVSYLYPFVPLRSHTFTCREQPYDDRHVKQLPMARGRIVSPASPREAVAVSCIYKNLKTCVHASMIVACGFFPELDILVM